jgi:hypothetical protein
MSCVFFSLFNKSILKEKNLYILKHNAVDPDPPLGQPFLSDPNLEIEVSDPELEKDVHV